MVASVAGPLATVVAKRTQRARGVGLSHERSDIAGAESLYSLEGNMCGTAMRGADPLARRALFVAFEGMGVFDLTGPLTVFWSASTFMKQQGRHGYARHTVASQ